MDFKPIYFKAQRIGFKLFSREHSINFNINLEKFYWTFTPLNDFIQVSFLAKN